jgi:GT2 family glycosyltransferase
MYSISIVIPNFNGVNLLKENIPYVYRALSTSGIIDFEVIVADDASTDDSVAFLRKNFPEIIVIQNPKNKGFAGNTNTGIRAAQKDLVLALNSDVQLTDYYFVPLLPYFQKADTFGVMGRIVSLTGDKIQDGAKYPIYNFTNIVGIKNYTCATRTSLYTLFLSGANALMDREKLVRLGGFNELFNPYYAEDVDLSLSAWECGYKLYYEHNAVCHHPNSATIKNEPSAKVKVITKRNKILLHYLHLNGVECWCFLAKVIVKTFFRTLTANMKYYKALRQFYSLQCQLLACKKQRAKNKKHNIKEIVAFIKADIKNAVVEVF